MNIQGPETVERARRIGSSYVHETLMTKCPHCSAVLFARNGKCEDCGKRVTPPEKARVVYDAWPLKHLHARNIITDIQFSAGDRYYKHWYLSGLSSFGGFDFGRVGGSGDQNVGMAATERQAHHRELYRIGDKALGIGVSAYVNSVVLHEQEPEAVGMRISGRVAVNQARAAAIEIVKIGLDRLADAYGREGKTGIGR